MTRKIIITLLNVKESKNKIESNRHCFFFFHKQQSETKQKDALDLRT